MSPSSGPPPLPWERNAGQAPVPPKPRLVTPGDIQPDADGRIVWWRPGWGELARGFGWGWLCLAPLVLMLIVSLLPVRWVGWAGLAWLAWIYGFKLWLILIGLAIGGIGKAIRKGTQARQGPFCIHCGYSLVGLPDHHICPECGRPFSFELVEEYRKDPAWFVQRWNIQRKGYSSRW